MPKKPKKLLRYIHKRIIAFPQRKAQMPKGFSHFESKKGNFVLIAHPKNFPWLLPSSWNKKLQKPMKSGFRAQHGGKVIKIVTKKIKGYRTIREKAIGQRKIILFKTVMTSRDLTELEMLLKFAENQIAAEKGLGFYYDKKTGEKYVITEFVDGFTLNELKPLITRLDGLHRNNFLKKCANWLAEIHSKGIIHGDLTFQNMILPKKAFRLRSKIVPILLDAPQTKIYEKPELFLAQSEAITFIEGSIANGLIKNKKDLELFSKTYFKKLIKDSKIAKKISKGLINMDYFKNLQ